MEYCDCKINKKYTISWRFGKVLGKIRENPSRRESS